MQPIEHVRALCDIGPRPPTSDAEARAAAYAKARLEAAGAREVSVEPFRNVAAGWKAFEIPLVIGMPHRRTISAAASVAPVRPFLYLMVAESGILEVFVTNFLPKRTSQNVYGTIPPKKKAFAKLVVIGHLDGSDPILFHPAIVRISAHPDDPSRVHCLEDADLSVWIGRFRRRRRAQRRFCWTYPWRSCWLCFMATSHAVH
jgi:hypothetical protein